MAPSFRPVRGRRSDATVTTDALGRRGQSRSHPDRSPTLHKCCSSRSGAADANQPRPLPYKQGRRGHLLTAGAWFEPPSATRSRRADNRCGRKSPLGFDLLSSLDGATSEPVLPRSKARVLRGGRDLLSGLAQRLPRPPAATEKHRPVDASRSMITGPAQICRLPPVGRLRAYAARSSSSPMLVSRRCKHSHRQAR
jgi:hypothetical protein